MEELGAEVVAVEAAQMVSLKSQNHLHKLLGLKRWLRTQMRVAENCALHGDLLGGAFMPLMKRIVMAQTTLNQSKI
ncbi:MAG: hypothetical protein AAF642_02155 [Pseudomonadota bacterium]